MKIDRKNKYKYVENLKFPVPNDNTFTHFHTDTIIDGELVLDEFEDGEVIYSSFIIIIYFSNYNFFFHFFKNNY